MSTSSSSSPAKLSQMDKSTVWTTSENDHKLQSSWCFWYDKKTPYKTTDAASFHSKLVKLGNSNSNSIKSDSYSDRNSNIINNFDNETNANNNANTNISTKIDTNNNNYTYTYSNRII